MSHFAMRFVARPEHIDIMGHVNNAVWVQWVQDIAMGHWEHLATQDEISSLIWLVSRHEIDYRGNIGPGDSVIAETWIPDRPSGARFDRLVAFRKEIGPEENPGAGRTYDTRPIVTARSTWAMLNRETGRPMRVPHALSERFLAGDQDAPGG